MKSILLLLILFLSLVFNSCTKEMNRQKLGAYFNYAADGKQISIGEEILWKENTFECTISGDTSLYIHATKVYNGAGFHIKADKIEDGTYVLDSTNRGFYENPNDNLKYWTNNTYRGTIKLKKGKFQGKTELQTLQAEFAFETYNSMNRKVAKITGGKFLMEVKYQ